MNSDDRSQLELLRLEMTGKLNLIIQQLNAEPDGLVRKVSDHETRLRKVEAWKYGIPIGVIMGLAMTAVALFR